MIKGAIVKYTKVNGWAAGPKKPTTTDVEGTAAQAKTAVDAVLDTLANMNVGESVHVILSVEPDET